MTDSINAVIEWFSINFDGVADWFYSISGSEIVAIILLCLAITLVFTIAKTALKIGAAVIGFLAVLYLTKPEFYQVCVDLLERFFREVITWFQKI